MQINPSLCRTELKPEAHIVARRSNEKREMNDSRRDSAELNRTGSLGLMPKPQTGKTAQSKSPAPEKSWTVLYYASAGDRMEEIRVKRLLDLEKVGSNEEMNILAQIDRGGEYLTLREHGGKPGVSRYYVHANGKLNPGDLDGYSRYNPPTLQALREKDDHQFIVSPELAEYGQLNASDPKVFKDFLTWGMKNYPAKNYLIMVIGHGAGVTGLLADHGPEAEKENHTLMTLPEFAGAVKSAEKAAGVKKEQVVIDIRSCLIGTAETAFELRNAASQLVDSQSVLYSGYWRPADVVGHPRLPELTPKAMGDHIAEVNATGKGNLKPMAVSAQVDLKQIPKLRNAIRKFETAVQTSTDSKEILKDLLEVKSRPNFFDDTRISRHASDFYTLAQSVAENGELKDPELKKAALHLQQTLDRVIVRHSKWENDPAFNKNAHGMGVMTAPDPRVYQQTKYHDLAFEKQTGWSEFITSYAPQAEEGQLERLEDLVSKSESLNTIADLAEKGLQDKVSLNKAIAETKRKIRHINNDSSLTPLKQGNELIRAIRDTQPIAKIYALKNANRKVKKIMEQSIDDICIAGRKDPTLLRDLIKTNLLVYSALEGEISSKTLSAGARKLLESRKNIGRDQKIKTGASVLYELGKNSRNDRIVALKNQHTDDLEFLKALAELEK